MKQKVEKHELMKEHLITSSEELYMQILMQNSARKNEKETTETGH